MKWMLEGQSGPSRTMYMAGNGWKWPQMAKTCSSGAPSASDIDFRTNMVEATLIHNTKLMLGVQMGPS